MNNPLHSRINLRSNKVFDTIELNEYPDKILSSNLLITSKKIKKRKRDSSPDSLKNIDNRKYETVKVSTKKQILIDLKRSFISLRSLEQTPEELSTTNLFELIEDTELPTYNKILAQVLQKHLPFFEETTKILTQWRRKIKSWLHSADRPENRGGLLITHHILGPFREKVIKLLKSMRARIFPELRRNVLKILEEFQAPNWTESQKREFNKHACSKHWWFNFLKKNLDIKQLWESIPLERTICKTHGSVDSDDRDDYSTESSPNETQTASPNSQVKIEIPINNLNSMEEVIEKSLISKGFKVEEPLDTFPTKQQYIMKEEERIQKIEALPKAPLNQEQTIKMEEVKMPLQLLTRRNEQILQAEQTIQASLNSFPLLSPLFQMNYLQLLMERRKMLDLMILQTLQKDNSQSLNLYKMLSN